MAFPLIWLNSFFPTTLRTTITMGVKGPFPDLLPILVTCRRRGVHPDHKKVSFCQKKVLYDGLSGRGHRLLDSLVEVIASFNRDG